MVGYLVAQAVLASMKVRNLKANHNGPAAFTKMVGAVLASMKVRNLKANHNRHHAVSFSFWLY